MSKREEELVASLLLNTKRKKRLTNLLQIAEEINELKNMLNSLENVSQKIGISVNMINQFLSVLKLNPRIQQLIKERKVDSVSFVRYLNRFSQEDQTELINGFLNGKINSQDIRALGPLKTKYPRMNIKNLIERLNTSKDIKISVAYFSIPKEKFNEDIPLKKISEIIGKENLISFDKKGFLGKLKITPEGESKLRIEAKRKSLSLRNLIQIIFSIE